MLRWIATRCIYNKWQPYSLVQSQYRVATGLRSQTSQRSFASESDYDAARKWFAQFEERPIANDIGEVSYARSSGPGGQNVNKVNSKAQLRVSLDQLLPKLPDILHEGIRNSRFHAERTGTLLFQSDESRKQTANRDACYRRLSQLIEEVYHQTVPGETSEEQKKRVRALKHAENESRLRRKKVHSSKKAARGNGGRDE